MSTTQSINDESRRNVAASQTTGRRRVLLRLLRKEAKQLAPFFIVLIACGVFLHVVGLFQQAESRAGFHSLIFGLIPILFAVGVGPVLISQEKEQRTLQWMASLPVPSRSIVISKLIVSLSGLVFIWFLSFATTLIFYFPALSVVNVHEMDWLFWLANTFHLMMMGFALAWVMPTAGSTLVALLFAGGAAGLSAAIYEEIASSQFHPNAFLNFLSFFQFLITVVLSMAAIKFGKRSFVAEAKSGFFVARASKREHSDSASDRTRKPPLGPASSLLWQVARQNRMLWVAAFFIVVLGLVSFAFGTVATQGEDAMPITAFIGCLVLSCLGASVFGSDANHGRIRFLSERGISPFKIWWTRLAPPVSGVIFGSLVLFLLTEIMFAWNPDSRSGPMRSMGGLVVVGVLMTFGFTQWLPQWTQSTLIAFCISPVLAIFSFIYISFLLSYVSPPWLLLFASVGISFAATRIMLCPWMDGRMGLKYWLAQSGLLVAALALPLIPYLITAATYPDMPTDLRRELTEEVKSYEPFTGGVELVMPANPNGNTRMQTPEKFIGFGASVSDSLVGIERQLSSVDGPVVFSPNLMRAVIREAQLMSLRMDADNDISADREQEFRDRYRRSSLLLSKFAIRMRMSDGLLDQEVSDRIEHWLVSELQKSGREELFSDEEYSTIITALADQRGRQQSRRRAVVVAWRRYTQQHTFGGIELPAMSTSSMAESWLVADRNVGQATAALLQYLESKPSTPDQFSADIHSFWPVGPVETLRALPIADVRVPALLWHQEWETEAAQLKESLK